ncbi:type II toxin-antitoxin system MqsA family antitoxin [Aquibaculum sediminis]|uniref:type II toxin-antitoxin system MqsA family antitoxin n=1 Tax=Aquibaculum sediminis TaxID=3231907 RepID=UPI003456133B
MAEQICPKSGHPMVRDIRPMTIEYQDHSLEVDMPGWYCEHCGEGVHTGKDMIVSDRALNRLKAQVEGLLLPETVKRIRKRLKLTQREAGTIIGGGPNAFQKYESGEILVSKAVASALLLLDRNPENLAILRSRNEDHHAAA